MRSKKDIVLEYCASTACKECVLKNKWVHEAGEQCLDIRGAAEKDIDWALALINGASGDPVNHPGHYETGKFECIDVMTEAIGLEYTKGFCLCNAFKYIYRCTKKHETPVEDVKKAIWYLNKFLELEGGSE